MSEQPFHIQHVQDLLDTPIGELKKCSIDDVRRLAVALQIERTMQADRKNHPMAPPEHPDLWMAYMASVEPGKLIQMLDRLKHLEGVGESLAALAGAYQRQEKATKILKRTVHHIWAIAVGIAIAWYRAAGEKDNASFLARKMVKDRIAEDHMDMRREREAKVRRLLN